MKNASKGQTSERGCFVHAISTDRREALSEALSHSLPLRRLDDVDADQAMPQRISTGPNSDRNFE